MNDIMFPWVRFWCSRKGTINLSDDGYLYNPESEYGPIFNEHVVSFDKISEVPCLVLLGEPGIGKTEALRNVADKEGNHTLRIDLRSYGTEERLIRNVFENPLFLACLRGERTLHLFLDSLDECLLQLNYVAGLLAEEFQKHKDNSNLKNLYLRIACRTADWPSLLERELGKIWGDENIQIMELAPLRRVDVYSAASSFEIDADKFMSEVSEKEVVPLAIKPVTLKFLLNLYKQHGSFPSTQKELYMQGCELLCEETNESRVSSQHVGNLRAKDRLRIASRIAALMVFSNKYAVWRGINFGNIPDEDLTLGDISGESLRQSDILLKLSESEIEETLSTGLFTSRGLNRFGWAHQTYAEFLAAWFITQHELSTTQIMSLIEHPLGEERKLVPQLHEVSSWISMMNVDVFRQITEQDPQILLRSDVASTDVGDKRMLVASLLELYDAEKIMYWDSEEYFYKLKHPSLAEQIKTYVIDQRHSNVARRAAIRIAKACQLSVLQEDLFRIALNQDEEYQLRVQAGYALCELAEGENTKRLIPLAKSEAGEDADDELKGVALHALWPQYISGEELFAWLTIPKRRKFTGAYRMFLNFEVFDKLQASELPFALRWVLTVVANYQQIDHRVDDLIFGIMNKAGEHLDQPDVLMAFTNVIRVRLEHFDDFRYISDLLQRHTIRRSILCSLINNEASHEVVETSAINWLIRPEDFSWMIERLQEELATELRRKWIGLIQRRFDTTDSSQVDLLFHAMQNNEMLAAQCQIYFQSIPLHSEQARELKKYYTRINPWQNPRPAHPPIHPPILERIGQRLNEFEAGNLDAWWLLNWELGVDEESRRVEEFVPNIKSLPNWEKVSFSDEVRILSAARKYLLDKKTEADEWFGTNIWHRPAMSGYRALRLVYEQDYGFLLSLASVYWENWTPVILTQWVTSRSDEEMIRHQLLKLAYDQAPDKVISNLLQLILKENEQDSNVFIISAMKECWDAQLGKAVLNMLMTRSLAPESVKCLLDGLLGHQIRGSEEFAKSLISSELLNEENSREKAVIAAILLLKNLPTVGWDTVWSLKESQPDFVKNTFLSLSNRFEGYSLLHHLPDVALADLYIWLVQQFPYHEDPNHDDDEMAHFVGLREEVAEFRDKLLRYLSSKGTLESSNQVARIVAALPELPWLKWKLVEAQNATRRDTWSPLSPKEIIQLAGNRHSRLVQSEQQLLETLIESLKRLEQKLHGITPEVKWLWNEVGRNLYRPRSENDFSDYVKQHLEEDLVGRGIVVNREVEIRSSAGSMPGERTDIHVNAALSEHTKGAFEVITVIVEVKGNWHRELFQAMETQLVGRYLKEGKCKFGLYLIGWFESSIWDNEDRRKSAIPSCGLEHTKKRLIGQSTSLSELEGTTVRSFVMNLHL
ncbi:hypothetical protein SAMN02799630_05538 [Paenibacillus sp. UNCCL117]|uniref:NACHT domain-containing protein n=1 Tax=unclassified Paenibacillus TaxID=185978 RepID=UPI00087EB544|nr:MULTISPECIES: hypothetical protein [unclassified Paenibacillus]SDE48747.1 hypothetical protein SAMN04488602_13017 [Paenibacillus sp. cl123]SFW66726.1 hypothetical protein SAMN02799630_05538 [Paenibacillus sp. UNCCL117]